MIYIEHLDNYRLKCWHEKRKSLALVFSSLISARFSKKEKTWSFDLRELSKLVDNLDILKITDRIIDDVAIEEFVKYSNLEKDLKFIKTGKNNFILDSVKFKTKQFLEQKTGSLYLLQRNKSGIFDEMGLGKTKQVLDTLQYWKDHKMIKSGGIVICPNTAKFSWTDEIKKHSNFSHFEIGNGTELCKRDISFMRTSPRDLFIIHMDSLRYIVEDLMKLNPGFIFVDEYHFFKNIGNSRVPGSLRTQALFFLINEWEKKNKDLKVIIMTGTPIAERPEEAYSVLQMLMPGFVSSYSRFISRFCVYEDKFFYVKNKNGGKAFRKKIREVAGYKNLRELKDLIEFVGIRRLKSEVEDFPEKMEIKKYIVLDKEHLKNYEKVKAATRQEIVQLKASGTPFNVKNKFVRLMQIINNPAILGGHNYSCKYELLDELLDEIMCDQEEKVILWTIYRKAIELLFNRYNKLYGADCIFGDVKIQDRGDIVKRFNNDKKPRLLICNPQAGGVALNLQRAQTAIYVDCMFSLTQRLQSEDRIHRRSSKGTVRIISIVAKDTIDEGLIEILKKKKNLKEALLTSDDLLVEQNKEYLLSFLK